MRVHMFSTGVTKTRVGLIKLQGGDADYTIPIPWTLIKHTQGNVIFDGGISADVVDDKLGVWGQEGIDTFDPILTHEQTCVAQCRSVGVEPQDVSYVIQSHMHRDHTGAIGWFPNAEHIVQRIEYEYAFNPEWFMASAYHKLDYSKPGLKWRMLEQEEADTFDLFGDGSIRLISTPGHTIGHQSMILRLPQTGHILLTADACYTKDHWDEKCLPGISVSNSEWLRSLRKLREIAAATGALVVLGHDPDVWAVLKTGPDRFYE